MRVSRFCFRVSQFLRLVEIQTVDTCFFSHGGARRFLKTGQRGTEMSKGSDMWFSRTQVQEKCDRTSHRKICVFSNHLVRVLPVEPCRSQLGWKEGHSGVSHLCWSGNTEVSRPYRFCCATTQIRPMIFPCKGPSFCCTCGSSGSVHLRGREVRHSF